jgi:endoglucanase
MLRANSLRKTDPEKAEILDRIAQQPQAFWVGDWNTDIFRAVQHFVNRAVADGAVPVMIAYNIPHRDCGLHSAGGLSSKEKYQRWIRKVAAGIGDRPSVMILEPDALGHIQECLTPEQREERFEMIHDAVRVLRQNPTTVVYIDAGHARWVEVDVIAKRLTKAGVEEAHGFSLNVSNYVTTEENVEYGKKVSALVGGAHFVIDTSRNGAGPAPDNAWCNPSGRKIGKPPTTTTGVPEADAFLWLKRPGESDGECNGGPRAGVFWIEQALDLAQ